MRYALKGAKIIEKVFAYKFDAKYIHPRLIVSAHHTNISWHDCGEVSSSSKPVSSHESEHHQARQAARACSGHSATCSSETPHRGQAIPSRQLHTKGIFQSSILPQGPFSRYSDAAPLERDEKHENMGFAGGGFAVEQFTPDKARITLC